MDTTLEGDDSELDDEELNDDTPESPDTKRDVKRSMKEDENDKLVGTLQFRSILQDELSFVDRKRPGRQGISRCPTRV